MKNTFRVLAVEEATATEVVMSPAIESGIALQPPQLGAVNAISLKSP
jgi:hypothetical protein